MEDGEIEEQNVRVPENSLLPMIAEAEGYNVEKFESGVWPILKCAVDYKIRCLMEEATKVAKRQFRAVDSILESEHIAQAADIIRLRTVGGLIAA